MSAAELPGRGPDGVPFDVDDPHIHFSRETGRWEYEDDDGNTLEWDMQKAAWIPVVDDELLRKQQAAYSVAGVDEEAPVEPKAKKRKKDDVDPDAPVNIKRAKGPTRAPAERQSKNTAVYVTGLPPDTTKDELVERFSKFGVLMEDDAGSPKIKLYAREDGSFNGEALVVYFKEESVTLAETMLDDAELRLGDSKTRMSVKKADFSHKMSGVEVVAAASTSTAPRNVDKKKATKRIGKMQRKLEDWGSDDDFGPSREEPKKPVESTSRVAVLKHMFTLAELDEDASLLLDLKEDVREECSNLGDVTNVVLYDKEPDGIMTVKFRDPVSAKACVLKMNGRFFAGRRVEAWLYEGKEQYRRTGDRTYEDGEDGEQSEQARLEAFRAWLVEGE
ncbi:hypothetical protein EXIGLDRAFT_739792 [Exidia glandulosa HHB12029]|uniref:RRM domain-containing protein n=1 Tax=Exidia glandulosa HHB12029 TaxID=1314781 RepID=A0A165JP81_EXIGL|nr:hypothetical protein EXIGLDRAFT_739792 [Exidia glandulosa HHB12029]